MLARTWMILAMSLLLSTPAAAQQPDPELQPDHTWISVSGTVAATDHDSFLLDYGEGTIVVEMDDWTSYGEARKLLDGDHVTVNGRVDAGLYESATIEACSVYVESLNTHFYANGVDEEGDASAFWNLPMTTVVTAATNLRGTVSGTDPAEQMFTLDTGALEVTVDTSRLDYNPLDEYGFQRIEAGDVVSVTGYLTTDFFAGREFKADAVVALTDASDS